MRRLSDATLRALPADIDCPTYERTRLKPRIAHLGLGNFHRAHQAWYTDAVLAANPGQNWGICGISLRSPAVRDRLAPQDGLYTLEVRDSDRVSRQVIGSVVDILVGPEDPQAVIDRLAEADVVTLTVTEKAYCLDAHGTLDLAHADIVHDRAHPRTPRSVIGVLAAGLAKRRGNGPGPQTVICCDNLGDNGRRLEQAMHRFLGEADPATLAWARDNVTFPCTMVDRIVPATTPELIASVSEALGVEDQAPVVTEPFSQWVIEDRFAGPAPDWAGAGALLVGDVRGFEHAKLRMLNGSHSTLAYLGCLAGLATVDEAVADPRLHRLLDRLMRDEVQPTLQAPEGLDLDAYREQLLQRFANAATGHRLRQIAMDGSQKLPPRLLGTVRDRLQRNESVKLLSLSVAAWLRYLRGTDLAGNRHEVDDPQAVTLQRQLTESADAAAFMRASGLFGDDLPEHTIFTSAVQGWLDLLDAGDIDTVLGKAGSFKAGQ